jgi:PST family polysaccharide transporter
MKTQDSSLGRSTVVGLLWMGSGQGVYGFLQILILAILARLITPAEFGVISAALVVITFSKIFYQLGIGPALVQRPQLEDRHLKTAFVSSVVFGVILGLLVWASAPLVASFFQMERLQGVLRVLSGVFPLLGLGLVSSSQLERDLEFRWLASRDVVTFALGYGVVGVVAAYAGLGVWALVCGHFGQTILNVGALLIKRPPRGFGFEWRAFKELLYFGGGHTLARLGNFVAHQGDNLVVGRWLGAQALGFYGRAYQLMATPASLFAGVLDRVLFPTMAKVQDDERRLAGAYTKGIALVALVTLPVSLFLCALAPEIVLVALGPQWEAVTPIVQVFAVGLLLRTSYKLSDSITRATGAVYRRAWRQAVYAGLVLSGAWIGQHWGEIGVAFGVLVALAVNFTLMAELSLRIARIPWRDFWRAHVPALRLALSTALVSWLLATILRGRGIPAVLVLGLAGGGTLAWALLLIRIRASLFLGSDGLWMLQQMRRLLRPKGGKISRATVL